MDLENYSATLTFWELPHVAYYQQVYMGEAASRVRIEKTGDLYHLRGQATHCGMVLAFLAGMSYHSSLTNKPKE